MTVTKTEEGKNLTIALEGRLDTSTAPQLEQAISESIKGKENLVLDFAEIAYISSAGLRVLLSAQKIMNKQGKMVIRNVCDVVKEVFEVTGFNDILTIE